MEKVLKELKGKQGPQKGKQVRVRSGGKKRSKPQAKRKSAKRKKAKKA